MISFRDKYNAYMAAKKKADPVSLILSFLIAGGVATGLIFIYVEWRMIWVILCAIATVFITIWVFAFVLALLSRPILSCYFKKELTKLTRI